LTAHLDVKVLPAVAYAGEESSQHSFAEVLAAPLGSMKSLGVEGLASVLGSWLPTGGGAGLIEVLRSLAMEFLAKLRTEVDRILFFGLGLKIKATRDTRRRMVQALSRLGQKPKLLIGRNKHKRKASGLVLRPKSWAKPKAGNDRVKHPDLGQEESEEVIDGPEVSAIEPVSAKASETTRDSVGSSGSSELCYSGEIPSESKEVAPEMDPVLVPVPGKVAMNRSSPEFALASLDMSLISTESIALASPVAIQSSLEMIDVDCVLLGCTQTAPMTSLTPIPVGSTQIVPSALNLRDGSESASDLAVSKVQFLVNGLTEAQAWFLGWLRDGTWSQELLAAIDCFEVQTWRKNEVTLPLVCSMELPKLKAAMAGIWDVNRETVVRRYMLTVVASLEVGSSEAVVGVPGVTPTDT
jgi:hypothetical protein